MKSVGVSAEYQTLRSVLLYQPGPEIGRHANPPEILHLRPIDASLLAAELAGIIGAYTRLGIRVVKIDPTPITPDRQYLYNMMYCRDLLFMTPQGAILAAMANQIRQQEPLYAERALQAEGIDVLHRVSGEGRFEGADALWLSDRLVVIGVGNRTNEQAYRQLKEVLQRQGVECVPVVSRQKRTQHLLGTLQIVDSDLALVRHEIIDPEVIQRLKRRGFTVVAIPENTEVISQQAMNVVAVAPRTVVMAAGCPQTRELFMQAGLTIAAELELEQLHRGGGGLACATGILARG